VIDDAGPPTRESSSPAPRSEVRGSLARRLLTIATGLLLSLTLTSGCLGNERASDAAPSEAGPVRAGMTAPGFTLDSLDGTRVSLSDYRGRPVLVNFWASWCPPCREEFPVLATVRQAHAASGFEILGLSHNDGERFAREFIEERGAGWPMLVDPDDATWRAYGATGLPSSYLIDGRGVVRQVYFGPLDEARLTGHLSAIEGAQPTHPTPSR
jgi:cytochrome c biogenesis protein CcmG/thiol:disulfide interchange protein DsbE